jgi:hypothetical protein
VRQCRHPSRVHRGFTAYVSKASNANCVKHSQFGKSFRDPTIFHVEGKFTNRYKMELMM